MAPSEVRSLRWEVQSNTEVPAIMPASVPTSDDHRLAHRWHAGRSGSGQLLTKGPSCFAVQVSDWLAFDEYGDGLVVVRVLVCMHQSRFDYLFIAVLATTAANAFSRVLVVGLADDLK